MGTRCYHSKMGWRWAVGLLAGAAACATGAELDESNLTGNGGAGGSDASDGGPDTSTSSGGAGGSDASDGGPDTSTSSGGAAAAGAAPASGGASGSTSTGGSSGSEAGTSGGASGSAATGGASGDGGSGGGSGGSGGGSGGSGGSDSRSCPAGQFATAWTGSAVTCAAIDANARNTVNSSCFAYLGWNDSCSGCTTAPAKWGRAGGSTCANGFGQDNSCITPTLGSSSVSLFGLNTDGTVDSNDKFHLGLHCASPAGGGSNGVAACPAGELAVGVAGAQVTCAKASDAVLAYARQNCFIYLGWRDSCNGCSDPPTKWGRANDTLCDAGVGSNGTCTAHTLGTETVNLAGINPGGNVDDNDKFYVALHCAGAQPGGGNASGTCPAGQLVTGVNADGSLTCASPAPAIEQALAQGCWLYFGWRDSCNACTNAPSKWGRVSSAACQNGTGSNGTCSVASLGTESVRLFGLNTDGTVGNDDKFYVGLRCD
jgi:hypothetical protein